MWLVIWMRVINKTKVSRTEKTIKGITVMAKTTSQIISAATTKLSGDITSLSARRTHALSVFRKTAEDLGTINADLTEKVNQMDALANFIAEEKSSATQMISDNEAVRTRILEIIGEK